ncbi:MAG: TonB family protein, partial [Phenylobacterium sp.]|nr:TonB family protein [Phenylobacterium sp.]
MGRISTVCAAWAILAATTSFAQAPGTSATAAPPPAAVVTNPDWLRRPTVEDVQKFYPALANALTLEGYALISCSVAADGRLPDCRALEEAPRGLGFGDAAVAMSRTFLMRPQTINGRAVAGGNVRVPIRFTLPPPDPTLRPPPEPASAGAMREALRLVDESRAAAKYEEGLRRDWIQSQPINVPEASRKAAMEALSAATEAARPAARDALAKVLASIFSEAELRELADLAVMDAKYAEVTKTWEAESRASARGFWARAAPQIRDHFCKSRSCATLPPLADVRGRRGWLDAPRWLESPDAARLANLTPTLPDALGLTGSARLACVVQSDGRIGQCAVDAEAPEGLGFGRAALRAASDFTLDVTQLADGVGRRVLVQVTLSPRHVDLPATPPVQSPRALELAHQALVLQDAEGLTRRNVELQLLGMEARPAPGVDPKATSAGIAALRAGAPSAIALILEHNARLMAGLYDEAYLEHRDAYERSATARAYEDRADVLSEATNKVGKYVA